MAAALFQDPAHRTRLHDELSRLLHFHRASAGGPLGFRALGHDGRPLFGADETFQIHDTTRMVHVYAVAAQLGLGPAPMEVVDQGMAMLWDTHRDARQGGYCWGVDQHGPVQAVKLAYGHAFVLLAAASALNAGHPDAPRLLADISEVIEAQFWDPAYGVMREEFQADWSEISTYRGQNANMHMTEALMAAHEATGAAGYLDKAVSISRRIIDTHARALGWRVAEHFTIDWQVDRAYSGDPMFRPAGITPGHALEWARLLIQLFDLTGRAEAWMPEAAHGLFAEAVRHGWDRARGGFFYTLDWDNQPLQPLRLWWPNAEGLAAAATLIKHDDDARARDWYRRIWDLLEAHFIDPAGGWFPELDARDQPGAAIFAGKPDIYHAFQACLVPLLPPGKYMSAPMAGGLA